jgi:tetratricopeptide (TPR) repeat protein
LNSGDSSSSGKGKRGKPMVPASPSVTRPSSEPRDRTLETLDEYMGSEKGQATSTGDAGMASSGKKEVLPQEWEIDEPSSQDSTAEEDVFQRLDRMEKRLDAFENTAYTFLLYAKQLTDRTASFFEDIFGLSQNDIAQIHDRLGVNFNNKGDFPKAIDAFRHLSEIQRTASSCFKMGVAYDNNGDYQEAIEAYRSSISLDEGFLRSYYKLSDVYTRTQNYGEAIRCLTQAAEMDQENADTHFRLGTVHSARGSHDQAINAFNLVLKLEPEYSGIYQSLGLAYEQKGEHNKAIEFFKKSI